MPRREHVTPREVNDAAIEPGPRRLPLEAAIFSDDCAFRGVVGLKVRKTSLCHLHYCQYPIDVGVL
jgi:hypothetical protein